MDGLAMLVQGVLKQDPFNGHLFVFRGRKANLIKIIFWDGTGCACSPSGWSRASFCGRRGIDRRDGGADLGATVDAARWCRLAAPERRWRPAVAG